MIRPLAFDIFGFILPLGLGGCSFVAGRFLLKWPLLFQRVSVVVAVAIVGVVGTSLAGGLPSEVNGWLSNLGGGTVILSWVALFMLGIVSSNRKKSLSPAFLGFLIAIAGLLILVESSGRLWWRFCAEDLWERTADSKGCLKQSSGLTCSPAAGVMLLYCHGIVAGEGELAYLASTSLLGTDAHSLARALTRKVEERGWHADVEIADYETRLQSGGPFVAHIRKPNIGGHAVFVARITEDFVEIIDPLDGTRGKTNRSEFQDIWDGTAIQISHALNLP